MSRGQPGERQSSASPQTGMTVSLMDPGCPLELRKVWEWANNGDLVAVSNLTTSASVLELANLCDHCFNSCSQAIAENVPCSEYICVAACYPEEDKSLVMGAP